MTAVPNGKMIEIARHIRGVTQKGLASDLKITQSTLSKLERGEFGVSDATAKQISKILDFPHSFFYQTEVRTPISNIYFRKRASISQKDLDRIIGDVNVVLKSIDYLLEEIEITEYPKYKFDISEGWTPQTVATRMREILRMPSGPINEPIKLLEELGIIVFLYDCKEMKFDGLTAYTDNGVPVIFVNKNMPNDRIRFTLGHELCHLVCHIPCDIEPWRDFETEANQFPGEFYMPTKDCKSDLQRLTYNNLTGLKAFWGLSKAAIIYKAKSAGFISEATYKYMMIELGRRNERKSETGFVEIDNPTTLKQIVDLLRTEVGYSQEDIAEKLCIGVSDYRRLFDPPPASELKAKVKFMKRAI
jgi:Zn-dependent peptidase ImmA (M78 family)/plasmid maintenance system antidote protein VapI